jgi:hypothetical protein
MAIAYTRSSSTHDLEAQSKTIRLAASLYGHNIDNGGWKNEPLASSDNQITHLLETASPGTTLIIANPYVLSAKPSLALSKAREAIGRGINLVIASEAGGVPNLAALNAVLAPIEILEARIAELEGELSRKDSELAEEMDNFQRAIEEKTIELLAQRGITFGHLLRPTGKLEATSLVAKPNEGRALKALREDLKYSQADVGALVDPPVDKSVVSRAETNGSQEPRYMDILEALQMAAIQQEQIARQAVKRRGVDAGKSSLVEGVGDMLSKVAT